MPSKKIPPLSSRDGGRSGRQQKVYEGGATAHLLNADPDRMHDDLQAQITGALGQLSRASALLTSHADLAATAQLDDLLEEVIRQQNEISDKHNAWADATGADASRTMNLGITGAITKQATQRFDGQDHNKEIYYERTIQTLEQQLLAFQQGLNGTPAEEYDDIMRSASEPYAESRMDGNNDEQAVAEYMRKCRLPTHTELIEEDKSFQPFFRAVHYDVVGCFLFFFFIVVTIGYAYIRVRYSIQPLGILAPYGAVVFGIEMLGAMSIIFYGIWLVALPDNGDITARESTTELRRQYHIRVLVPCYSEPLPIVQRTILAARRAIVPPGCTLTIYLCDDGKKADKRKFCDSLSATAGPAVIYVTGRKRSAGKTLNGKSENLNHTLKLIYPEDRGDDEVPNIPLTEVMCLFDADQSCSKTFFTSLMPFIDSGDNVAVALSPQLMFNVDPDTDIFNHQNVHFWEKMQPGMDALGFISLTGTNMILRCRALQDCGWFPVDSVTEDWELGMRMKKWGWQCRYVQQYNAIGEAPDEVRQCFQQRSRWCKGHFQTFWSKQCPLVDRRLGLLFQLCYSSTCLSYISAALAVPTMTLVPIVTLLFGYFPIALNFWTVVGLTVYYVALHALTYYCRSMREFRALWLANVGTTILFWPYFKAALFTPMKQLRGQGLAFKATSKGGSKASVSLKEIGPSLLLVCLSLLAFICGIWDFDINVNAPKAIALAWVIYNIVPHLLLLVFARFGNGGVLKFSCTFLMYVQSIVSLLALILLWLLYPREENYVRATNLSLNFLQAQRSGALNQPYPVSWRKSSGQKNQFEFNFTQYITDEATGLEVPSLATEQRAADLSGGFYTDGEIGPIKITTHVAMATSMLAWSLLDYSDWWAKDGERLQDALELVSHGMKYVDACYIQGNSFNNTDDDLLIFQVGDIRKERQEWHRPEDLKIKQEVGSMRAASSPADLAAQIVSGSVAGAIALHKHAAIDYETANGYVKRAHRLFTSAMLGPSVFTASQNVTNLPIADHFPSNSYLDDLFWASTWMLRSSLSEYGSFPDQSSKNLAYYYVAMRTTFKMAFSERDSMAVSLDYLNNVALVHAAVITKDWSFHSAAQSWIWDWICSGGAVYTTFGRAHNSESMLLGDTTMASAIAAVYVNAARKWKTAELNNYFLTGFHCFAEGQGRLILGVNYRKPLLTGFNSRDYKRLWHRGATCPEFPAPCERVAATLNTDIVNPLNGALLWLPGFRDTIEDRRAQGENGTVVSLDNNVAVPLLFAALAHRSESAGYMDCLQGQGALLPHPVCRFDRPLSQRLGPEDTGLGDSPSRFRGLWTEEQSVAPPPPPPPAAFTELLDNPLDGVAVGPATATPAEPAAPVVPVATAPVAAVVAPAAAVPAAVTAAVAPAAVTAPVAPAAAAAATAPAAGTAATPAAAAVAPAAVAATPAVPAAGAGTTPAVGVVEPDTPAAGVAAAGGI